MNATLNPESSSEMLSLDDVQIFSDGSRSKCFVRVASGSFRAGANFYFDYPRLHDLADQLQNMYVSLVGSVRLGQHYEEPYLELTVNRRGQLKVKGYLVCHGEMSQEIRFGFSTDQTTLPLFVSELRAICAEHSSILA